MAGQLAEAFAQVTVHNVRAGAVKASLTIIIAKGLIAEGLPSH
jgi:hypothetical protein